MAITKLHVKLLKQIQENKRIFKKFPIGYRSIKIHLKALRQDEFARRFVPKDWTGQGRLP
ncbi:Uncharacterised protein [Legionella beliardensis]|uniref:Uncharacterized protein n=1 Tax=Legionella beliardensis TaxID=91822 RepID=A0A378I296_9GAMM|nr:Uncharacterised protein [Legionella beliardensis]